MAPVGEGDACEEREEVQEPTKTRPFGCEKRAPRGCGRSKNPKGIVMRSHKISRAPMVVQSSCCQLLGFKTIQDPPFQDRSPNLGPLYIV